VLAHQFERVVQRARASRHRRLGRGSPAHIAMVMLPDSMVMLPDSVVPVRG
jgi:hypothetical protein